MTEGQVLARAVTLLFLSVWIAETSRAPNSPLSRLGVRRDEKARRYILPKIDDGAVCSLSAPRSIPICKRAADLAIENSTARQYGQEYHARQAASVLMDVDGYNRYAPPWWKRARLRRQPVQPMPPDAMRQPEARRSSLTCMPQRLKPRIQTKLDYRPSDAPICLGNAGCPHNYGHGYGGSDDFDYGAHPFRSIRLPCGFLVSIGDQETPSSAAPASSRPAHDMGIRTPLPDTPSLPIGADEVTVLDHTGAYATFPNLGKAVTAHAILEVRTGAGELVWRFDRDGPKPRQVLSPQVAGDMIKNDE